VKSFFKKFPNYQNHDLYLSGESYAGIYVPYLAWQIDTHNEASLTDSTETFINLKGILVGNGVTDFNIDVWPSYIQTLYNFNMISKGMYDNYTDNKCNYTFRDAVPFEAQAS